MIFIDTGAFLARSLKNDSYHLKALQFWEKITKQDITVVTSQFVISETLTLFHRWAGTAFAVEKARNLYESQVLKIIRTTRNEEYEAIDVMEKYADQNLSFTDCVSFVIMRRQKIQQAFSFDKHFQIAGFELWS